MSNDNQFVETIHYSMQIVWSPEDSVYIVSVPEFPGLHTHGATYEEAVAMGKDAIAEHLAVLRNTGRSAPRPRLFRAAVEASTTA